jgi:hypothetical protein
VRHNLLFYELLQPDDLTPFRPRAERLRSAKLKILENFGFLPISRHMGSIAQANPGVTDVLQLLSGAGSASLSSALSSPAVQSALKDASPEDIVHLSAEALQLQDVGSLFGTPDPAPTSSGSATGSTSAASAGALESQLISELFGTSTSSGAANTPVSLLG